MSANGKNGKNDGGLKGGGPEGKNLQDLTAADIPPLSPKPPKFATLEVADVEQEAAQLIKRGNDVEATAKVVLSNLKKFQGLKTKEARELATKKLAGQEDWLKQHLWRTDTHSALRRRAWLAVYTFFFSQDCKTYEQASMLLDEMVKAGYLKEDTLGPLEMYRRHFKIPDEASFDADDLEKVQKMTWMLAKNVRASTRKTRLEKTQVVLKQPGLLTWEEVLQGEAGKYAFQVSAEQVDNGDTDPFVYAGGTLVVESKGGDDAELVVVDWTGVDADNDDGLGHVFEKQAQELAETRTRLMVSYLRGLEDDSSHPPTLFPSEAWPKMSPQRRVQAAALQGRVRRFWHLFRRRQEALEKNQPLTAMRKELANRATISPEEFFLGGKMGACLAEFSPFWRSPEGKVPAGQLFFVICREEKDGKPVIYLTDIPVHLEQFFLSCEGKFLEEGNNFGDIPAPLGKILRAIKGHLIRVSQIASNGGAGDESPAAKTPTG